MKAVEVQVQDVEGTSLHSDVAVWLLKLRGEISIENLFDQFLVIKTNSNISMSLGVSSLWPDASIQSTRRAPWISRQPSPAAWPSLSQQTNPADVAAICHHSVQQQNAVCSFLALFL